MSEEGRYRHQVPWLRIGAEAIAIVVSILLAFAIDAWWDGLKERQQEKESLGALLDELRSSRDELENDLAFREVYVDFADLLLEYISGEVVSLDADTVVLMIGRLRWPQMFTPPKAVLNELISSGRMNLIRSLPLRRNLLEYSQWLDKTEVNESQERRFLDDRFSPFLSVRSRYPLPPRVVPRDTSILSDLRTISASAILSASYLGNTMGQDLPSPREVFGNLLVERKEHIVWIVGRYRTILDLIGTLTEQIEHELRP